VGSRSARELFDVITEIGGRIRQRRVQHAAVARQWRESQSFYDPYQWIACGGF